MRPSEDAVLAVLDTVLDPCSVSVGVPMNIREMGLYTGVDIGEDGSVQVRMRLTTPGCFEGITKFSREIETGVGALDGVTSVQVDFADGCDWSEADINEEGRQKLEASRAAQRARLAGTQTRVQIARPPAERRP
jgi:metal-sulfur cluster biosynthetic enzyme